MKPQKFFRQPRFETSTSPIHRKLQHHRCTNLFGTEVYRIRGVAAPASRGVDWCASRSCCFIPMEVDKEPHESLAIRTSQRHNREGENPFRHRIYTIQFERNHFSKLNRRPLLHSRIGEKKQMCVLFSVGGLILTMKYRREARTRNSKLCSSKSCRVSIIAKFPHGVIFFACFSGGIMFSYRIIILLYARIPAV
jgi:hypothetical protein